MYTHAYICSPHNIVYRSNAMIFTVEESKKISVDVVTMKRNVAGKFSVFTANSNCIVTTQISGRAQTSFLFLPFCNEPVVYSHFATIIYSRRY